MLLRLLRVLGAALAKVSFALLALFGLSAAGVFPLGSALSGVSYLPPSWLTLLVLPSALLCLAVRRRWLGASLLAALGLVLLAFADYSWPSRREAAAPQGPGLSVVALNVRYYAAGRAEVARALKAMDADVALLSENVLDAAGAEELRRALAPADFRMGRSGETAIVSRYPILEFKEVELPSHQASLSGPNALEEQRSHARRSFVHALLDVQGVAVHALSLRLIAGRPPGDDILSELAWGLYLLEAQGAEVDFFTRYVSQLEGPVVFGGDLNATPSSLAVRRLARLGADSFLALHRLGTPTFRVDRPVFRLDYLFATRELVPLEARRLETPVVSDHFAVRASYRLAAGAGRGAAPARAQDAGAR